MKRVVRLVVMLSRPPVLVVLMLFAALGLAVGGKVDGGHPLLTTVLFIVVGWFIHATSFNDLADEQIDRVNLKDALGRPLVSGDATRAELLLLGLGAGGSALFAAWMVNRLVGIVVTAGLLLNVAYSFKPVRLSDRGLLAVILLPLGYVVLPFLVGLFSVRPTIGHDGIFILAGLYISFMGRIVLKDFRDQTGDRMFGKRTFLIRKGRADTCMFSAACWIVGSATLITIVPLGSSVFGVFVVYLACVLHGLFLLARAKGLLPELMIISAIAIVGRAMGITLLAHLTMLEKAWPVGDQSLVHLVLAGTFLFIYGEKVGQRESATAEAIRAY